MVFGLYVLKNKLDFLNFSKTIEPTRSGDCVGEIGLYYGLASVSGKPAKVALFCFLLCLFIDGVGWRKVEVIRDSQATEDGRRTKDIKASCVLTYRS